MRRYVTDRTGPSPAFHGREIGAALLVTFLLAYVVLSVTTGHARPDGTVYGLAVGFTVMAGSFAVGPFSGGAFNPAVALGTWVMGLVAGQSLRTYAVANLAGGAAAAPAFKALNPDDV